MAVPDPRTPTAACGRAHGFICRTAASNGLSALIELCRDQNGQNGTPRCRGAGAGLHSAAVVRQAQAATEAGSAALRGRGARAANLLKYKERYLLLIPALVLFLVFRYVPMAGIVLAWKQFTVTGGLFGSPWAGWKFFERLFASPDFFRVLRNTLFINGVLRMGIAFFRSPTCASSAWCRPSATCRTSSPGWWWPA